jgi:TRAP transporter 4TM/12TM fusion protein
VEAVGGVPSHPGIAVVSESETPRRRLSGWPAGVATTAAFALAVYALYWVVGIVAPQVYRPSFLSIALVITFLTYPAREGQHRVTVVDWLLVAAAVVSLAWPIVDMERFVYRAATPTTLDVVLGGILIVVVLEATRRTVGWILPATALVFLAYARFGPLLDSIGLSLIAHRGYAVDRVVGTLYMTLEGILGVPLDVAATYIVLFTVYGAIVEASGAGRFFVDWAMSAIGRTRSASAPGRTVTLAGYLLGAVSGSGVANTVMLGSVCWPMMRRARYPADTAGAILAAAGIGAILAPPVMGAAAFLIAEFLGISYFDVIKMAILPAALYYLSIVLTVEADSRRLDLRPTEIDTRGFAAVTREGWFYFASLVAIAGLMASGVTAFRAVFWATVVAFAVSFANRQHRLTPTRLARALAAGGAGVVPVVATTATAGIIVGVVTLTGLGLKAASLIVTLAQGHLLLTVLYSGVAAWVLGLAVPVTACYIIAAVMVVPALTQVGVPAAAAHMFVFYYSVLGEVSPPTALSPFAAAALTGGNPFKTTMIAWKYCLPAFVVPLMFTMSARGRAVLLDGTPLEVLWIAVVAAIGVAAIAGGSGGYIRQPASRLERVLLIAGGLMMFGAELQPVTAGAFVIGVGAALHHRRMRRA